MQPDTRIWRLDPGDPRAPTREQWDALTDEERERVYASLPVDPEVLRVLPGEGDAHYDAVLGSRESLRRWFSNRGSRAYVGVNKATYYNGERVFSPDIMVVLDVDPHPRSSWIVEKEGRGLDFALEVIDLGSRAKDLRGNVDRYARLGIPEYFVHDIPDRRLWGWRLATGDGTTERLVQQRGLFRSEQLGLELGLEGDRLRFYFGGGPLPDHIDLLGRLERAIDEVTSRAEEEAKRADEEASRADELARRVAELEAELRRNRGEGS